MTAGQVIAADLTWTGAQFEPGILVVVDQTGRIRQVDHRSAAAPTLVLRDQALVPGFVNAHSHAFQRGLRGLGERFTAGPGSFWTWREAMYGLVERLGPEEFTRLSAQTFDEMRRSGITSVGEFHYLHHTPATHDYGYDRLLLEAARSAGIRLVLLVAYYRTGGIGQPLRGPQRRFETPDPAAYLAQLDHLTSALGPHQSLGIAVHSVRAAPLDDIAAIHQESLRRNLVFHIHMEEQRREVEESVTLLGRAPLRALLDSIDTARNVTAVHCTHTAAPDADAFIGSGGRVCVCPLTEANLGDGIPDLADLPVERLCLGTDSNARIDMLEEMRWLEYGQRLRRETRGALVDRGGHVARTVFQAATAGGALALGLDTGQIAVGMWADFATIDLRHPTLADAGRDELLESLVFSAGADVVRATCVGGQWREH